MLITQKVSHKEIEEITPNGCMVLARGIDDFRAKIIIHGITGNHAMRPAMLPAGGLVAVVIIMTYHL